MMQKAEDFPAWQAFKHYVVFSWYSANTAVCHLAIWQEGK
jgi:hypothetical protein